MSSPLLLIRLWVLLLLFWGTTTVAQEAFKYSYLPKKVYQKQIFPVTLIDTREKKGKVTFYFETQSGLTPLSPKPLIIRNGNDSFYTFYFKATQAHRITIPPLLIRTHNEEIMLPPQKVPVLQLKANKDFCDVLAADMKIKGSQVSHYDEKHYLVTLSIEAYEANLEDMKLQKSIESGIEEINRHGAKVQGEFYAVVPLKQKSLSFTYYNTIKEQFIPLTTQVELLESSVVTQTDLNPKEDSFEKLKKYLFMALVGFFFLMFLLYRDFFYLVLGTVSAITLLTFYAPKKRVCIKQGAPLYILPTQTSSISSNIDKEYTTPLLGKRLEFNKVEYKRGIIGWIKDEDLCEN